MMALKLRRIVQALLLALSGSVFVNCSVYGAPMPHDPTVVLQDFSYTPASPIHVGDTLQLRAQLNHSTITGRVRAVFKNFKFVSVLLSDSGTAPDEAAGDGVYSASIVWGPELGNGVELPVFAELLWFDNAEGQRRDAPPLTVLPAEDEGQ